MNQESTRKEMGQNLDDMDRHSKPRTLRTLRIATASRSGYVGVCAEEHLSDDSETIPDLETSLKRLKLYAIVITIASFVFGVQSLFLWARPSAPCVSKPLENGYETEWGPAKAAIKQEEVIFTSAFKYNATAKAYYRDFSLGQPQYVGSPRPELDQAWEELLAGQYLVLSKNEAKQLDDPVPIKGIYLAEVEVMHSLHCVNAIRKALYQDYYLQHDMHALPGDLQQIHIEHCLDQLRQTVQCAGDLTPVPLRPYGDDPNINLIGTPQAHTCRNWQTLRKWYTERGDMYGKLNGGGT